MWNSGRKTAVSLAVVMAVAAMIVGTNAKPPLRIRGGQDAGSNESSFVVRMGPIGCTGAIISPRHVLTAAHCINESVTEAVIYGGTRNRADQYPIITNVSRSYKHPQYGKNILGYDIGILVLDTDLDLSGRQTAVSLPTSQVGFKETGVQFGWSLCGADYQEALQKVSVSFLNKEDCIGRGYFDDYPRLLCVDAGMAETCSGDSGGPIVSNGVLVGVHTYAMFKIGGPSGAQNVYHYLDWINSFVGQRHD